MNPWPVPAATRSAQRCAGEAEQRSAGDQGPRRQQISRNHGPTTPSYTITYPLLTTRTPTHDLSGYVIRELSHVGDADTVALLHAYLPDPELGPLAVNAIRTIERRLAAHA